MFAALHLPDLEIAAALRVSPEARRSPCIVISAAADPDDPKAKLPVLAANPLARQAGISIGWPLNRALIRCPGLKVLARQAEAEAALLNELIDLAESLTPDLEVTSPDTLVLDISRASKKKIALLDEFQIPQAELWHARAPTPDLAHLAVLHEESQGGLLDGDYFQRLPLSLLGSLPGAAEFLPMLHLWGLRRLGDFMKLPHQELADRLGPGAARFHEMLHGKTCRLLRLHRPPDALAQSLDFEEPIHLTEPLIFAAKRLLHSLSARVAAKYLAVATLHISLRLESGRQLGRGIRLPEPLVDAGDLLQPLQTFLESLHLESSVSALDLDATTVSPNPSQREWFGRQLANPNRFADTLARLEALLGPRKVGIPLSEDSHRPDAFKLFAPLGGRDGLVPFSGQEHGRGRPCPLLPPPNSVPLRRFRPSLALSVAHEIHGKTPIPLALLTGPHPGKITARRGPFPLSGDWWEPEKSWHCLEWDVELETRHILRLAFLPPDQWRLEGAYA